MTTDAPPRTRLSREERRAQLIELGTRAVIDTSLDELSIEQIAEAAGISRGLLFHYFPTRRAYLAAIVRAGTDELLARTAPDPTLDPVSALRASLDAYVAYVEERKDVYIAIIRGAAGGDAVMQETANSARQVIVDRVMAAIDIPASDRPRTIVAVHGWVGFLEAATIAWVEDHHDQVTRTEHIELCAGALLSITAALGFDLSEILRTS